MSRIQTNAAEIRQLRRRTEDIETSYDKIQTSYFNGEASLTGITTTLVLYPTGTFRYVAVRVISLSGIEYEGQLVITTNLPVVVAVACYGAIPVVNSYVICQLIGGRWVLD